MAILAALIAFGSRFASKVLTTALGWASTLLFGRVPASRQILLLGITFGSVICMVMVVGFIVPDLGTFLLLLVPAQDFVPDEVIRLVMLAGAIVVPGVVGLLTLALTPKDERSGRRSRGGRARLPADDHAGGSARLPRRARDLAQGQKPRPALDRRPRPARGQAGRLRPGRRRPRPRPHRRRLRPHARNRAGDDVDAGEMAGCDRRPDVIVAGPRPDAPAAREGPRHPHLPDGHPHLGQARGRDTGSGGDGQSPDDLGGPLDRDGRGPGDRRPAHGTGRGTGDPDHRPRFDETAAAEFASIDEALATIRIPYEEWEVLYRQRLQVERDLRAGAMAGEAVLGADTPGIDGPGEAIASVARMLRQGASALVEAATDDETVTALDKLAGPRWRIAAQTADVVLVAAKAAVRGGDDRDGGAEAAAGEPAPFRTSDEDEADEANGTTGGR